MISGYEYTSPVCAHTTLEKVVPWLYELIACKQSCSNQRHTEVHGYENFLFGYPFTDIHIEVFQLKFVVRLHWILPKSSWDAAAYLYEASGDTIFQAGSERAPRKARWGAHKFGSHSSARMSWCGLCQLVVSTASLVRFQCPLINAFYHSWTNAAVDSSQTRRTRRTLALAK